jgi:hypothetical protein
MNFLPPSRITMCRGCALPLATALLASFAWPQDCRIIVYQGKVLVRASGGQEALVETTGNVKTGDTLRAASQATVAFLRAGASVERLELTSERKIACPDVPRDSGVQRLIRLIDYAMVKRHTTSAPLGYKSDPGGRPAEGVYALVPKPGDSLLEARPDFAWSSSASMFEVSVLSAGTERAIWRRVVSAVSSISYPASAPALEDGGSYVWEVRNLANPSDFDSASFHIAESAARHRMQQELQNVRAACRQSAAPEESCTVGLAGLLSQRGYRYDAIQLLLRSQEQAVHTQTMIAPALDLMFRSPLAKLE